MMKLYTKKGDQLNTSLYDGTIVSKDHDTIQLLGQIDEVIARFCFALSFNEDRQVFEQCETIIQDLMKLMSFLAHGRDSFNQAHTQVLEQWIDQYHHDLPPLEHFIIPYTDALAAAFNLCRTAIRQAERLYAEIMNGQAFNPNVAQYLNRLSDFAFVIVRYVTHTNHCQEIIVEGLADE